MKLGHHKKMIALLCIVSVVCAFFNQIGHEVLCLKVFCEAPLYHQKEEEHI